MNTYDFVHLALDSLGGEVHGKTKLQKTIYFLGILSDNLDDLGYRPHYYGPFSPEVAAAVDRLRALRFLDQNIRSVGMIDRHGFEVTRTDYRLTEEGRRIAEHKAQRHADFWPRLEHAVKVFRRANEEDYVKLSVAAKTFFMLGHRRGKADEADLQILAEKFGWSVSLDQIREGARYLKALALVEGT